MYQNILVAVALDHSPNVNDALKVARSLLDQGGRITALHVIEEMPAYIANQVPADMHADRMPAAASELKTELGGVSDVQPEVVYGHAGRTIVDYAENHGIDCIVIASHRPGLQDYFLGSTAQRVVRHAKCAVHVLR